MRGGRIAAARHSVEQGDRVLVGAERRLALEHRVERRAEREHIGGEGGVQAPRHLRRQVGRSAVDHARRRDRRIAEGVRDAEVADHRRTVGRDQDVAGFDVAVHDLHPVRLCERGGDLLPDPCRLGRTERSVHSQELRQRRRLDQLHHDAGLPLVLDHVEHGDRVRMVQTRGDPRLAHRPIGRGLTLRVGELRLRAQHLQRHRSVQPLIPRLPHDAHPARAEHLDQAVAVGQKCRGSGHRHRGSEKADLNATPAGPEVQGVAPTAPMCVERQASHRQTRRPRRAGRVAGFRVPGGASGSRASSPPARRGRSRPSSRAWRPGMPPPPRLRRARRRPRRGRERPARAARRRA